MAFALTEEQSRAVHDRGGGLLVSAAAGSGKTRVLVERLLDQVTGEGADIDDFLVITYTRAAAAELRARIAQELSDRLAERPNDRHLRRQTTLVYKAQISTVHAFCAALLRESGHQIGLDPDFRLCDEGEGAVLMARVLGETLDRQYEDLDSEGDFAALVDTMALELRQAALKGDGRLVLVPGNYGLDFLAQHALISDGIPVVRCSNFIGEALDQARLEGFQEVLLVGHIGKLVKLAGGIMNTHSRWADGRRELFCAHAALAGADRQTAQALMDCPTTDGCLEVLDQSGLREAVLTSLLEAIQNHLDRRFGPEGTVGAVLFSNQYGLLGLTPKGKELTDRWNNRN